MTVFFSPDGALNVAYDPSDLPESVSPGELRSGAMVRCKNLRLDEKGKARTRDGSTKLNSTAIQPIWWIEVQAGVRYAFAGDSIYRNESVIETGLTDAQWTAIQYNAFNDTSQNVFALNGTDRKRIQGSSVYEWGIQAPSSAPGLFGNGAGSLTGNYNAKYTYVRKVGSTVVAESNPSPAATFAKNLSSQGLTVVASATTDEQVTHMRLYRTTAGGSTYNFDHEMPAPAEYGVTYSFEEDAVSDTARKFTEADSTHATQNTYSWEAVASLGQESVSYPTYSTSLGVFYASVSDGDLGDPVETDHARPPAGKFVMGPAYDGTCFILRGNLLHYCKPKQPEYWPATYFVEVGPPQFPLVTGVFHNGQVYVLSQNEIYYVQGTGHGTFFPLPMKAKTGAQSVRGAVSVAGRGIYHTGPDGIYLFSSGSDVKVTEDALEPIFRGETVHDLPGVSDMSTSWLFVHGNRLYFGYASEGYDYPVNVLVFNLDTTRLAYYTYNDGATVEIRAIAADTTNKRIVVGDTSGYVRVIESPSYTDDSGTAISFEVQSKDYLLQTRRHFPRWCKYDVDASKADSCTGELILDGEVHQTHVITGNRDTRRRLVGEGNASRAAVRISGQGQVSIFAIEFE